MLHSYTQSLHHELAARRQPVAVTICAPGAMWTDMLAQNPVGKLVTSQAALRVSLLPVARVAKEALDGLGAGHPLVVPGIVNRVYVRATRWWPALGTRSALLYEDG